MSSEKTIFIDINLTKGWVAILGCLLLIALLFAVGAFRSQQVAALTSDAVTTSSGGMRHFYLTQDAHYGSVAKSACANGYHMASLWEIADPSNLKYNTTLGYSQSDSGQGPPSGESNLYGWVHTGYTSNSSTTVGRANCNNYTSHSFGMYGTAASLHSQWTSGAQDIGPWDAVIQECDNWIRVWCIED